MHITSFILRQTWNRAETPSLLPRATTSFYIAAMKSCRKDSAPTGFPSPQPGPRTQRSLNSSIMPATISWPFSSHSCVQMEKYRAQMFNQCLPSCCICSYPTEPLDNIPLDSSGRTPSIDHCWLQTPCSPSASSLEESDVNKTSSEGSGLEKCDDY